jgi:hypothetical protein
MTIIEVKMRAMMINTMTMTMDNLPNGYKG